MPGSDDTPNPDDHVYGANGTWSSFGCNAGNTRAVEDGHAPVDGLSERWRVPAHQTSYLGEPVVADEHVYFLEPDGTLRAYHVTDGSLVWEQSDVDTTPVVREHVFVGGPAGLQALDPVSGDPVWSRSFEGNVTTPATRVGDWLYVPVDETLYRLDAASGELDWSRRLFGPLVGPPALYFAGSQIAVASSAGELFLLSRDGTGWGRWDLPAEPQAPPTADTEGIYVNCLDGRTYGISLENTPRHAITWDVETGWNNGGLAVQDAVYAAGTSGLHAVDRESGDRLWTLHTGDWRHTAPALGRDTLFVGGDRLYALDPTPGGSPKNGPATRFEREFYGRVGPGPVLDDGSLYVVAQTGAKEYHLLAFD